MFRTVLPPTYCLIYVTAAIVLHVLFPIKNIVPTPYNFVGLMPLLLGILINIWADSLFKKAGTEVKSFDKPSVLVMTGPFRISRHPMYLGFVLLLLGVALALGSLISFYAPLVMALTLETLFIPYEERMCEREFGQQYLDYKKRVRRWF